MPRAVDVIVDQETEVAEIVNLSDDSEDDIVEVSADVPPLCFSGYRRGRELGQGAFARVFVCQKKGCVNGFVVKTINLRRAQLSSDAAQVLRQLRREADILKKMPSHPSIVQMVDAVEIGHWLLLVLELVAGGDLFTVLTSRATRRFLDREVAFVGLQIVDGLSFLHRQSVIHRDLKLENVLVASQRRLQALVLYTVKIADFGLSKVVGPGLSAARSTVGTLPYIAPEVMSDEAHHFSSDIFSFGVLLFILLTGRFPFDRIVSDQAVLDNKIMIMEASEGAKAVLLGFLQLDPAKRSSLELAYCHEWFNVDSTVGRSAKPRKRQRIGVLADIDLSKSPLHIDDPSSPIVYMADSCDSKPEPLRSATKDNLETAYHELMDFVDTVRAEPATVDLSSQPFVIDQEVECVSASDAGISPLLDESDVHLVAKRETTTLDLPKGAWTPFAEDASVKLSEVCPASPHADVLQVQMVTPERLAGLILGRNGARIQHIACTAGCRVWMTPRQGHGDRHIVMIGNYKQCKVAQELVHEQLVSGLDTDWRDTEAEVVLLVRTEAAGVVTGKRGFVLDQIRARSGARFKLLRDEVEGQRPCVISGSLQNVLRAQKYVFDLVRVVPVTSVARVPTDSGAVVEDSNKSSSSVGSSGGKPEAGNMI
eukprot:TRINITY_DN22451_c0_g1_i1.p1 TRINITY_DN22451_c0_g1~~TRINITY_DN22451_c0_g1_i1.p1  ORF type:complete len:652 (-),score=87.03 TRINITY_DN22451_c0_g1_i1:72-2027(-)